MLIPTLRAIISFCSRAGCKAVGGFRPRKSSCHVAAVANNRVYCHLCERGVVGHTRRIIAWPQRPASWCVRFQPKELSVPVSLRVKHCLALSAGAAAATSTGPCSYTGSRREQLSRCRLVVLWCERAALDESGTMDVVLWCGLASSQPHTTACIISCGEEGKQAGPPRSASAGAYGERTPHRKDASLHSACQRHPARKAKCDDSDRNRNENRCGHVGAWVQCTVLYTYSTIQYNQTPRRLF